MNQLWVTSETAVLSTDRNNSFPRANVNHKAGDKADEIEVKSNLEQGR